MFLWMMPVQHSQDRDNDFITAYRQEVAGSKRYACPQSTFMFHGVGMNVKQAARFEEKLLVENLDAIRSDQKRIGAIIRERSSLTEEQVAGLFLEAQTKDATFAAEQGIIDEIRDVDIPSGCPVIALVFKR